MSPQKENIDKEKKIWDETGVFPVTKQRLADQARQTRQTNNLQI